MRDFINQSMIWKIVGVVSAINGLVCFGLSSTYDMSFGKLGFGGHPVYLLLCLIIWCLMLRAKRIQVSEKVQGVVAALIFVVICSISVLLDKLMSGKSDDVLGRISYGSFALMSVSMSRKFELGFETGVSTFFLQLFASQLFKIKWFFLPIALVFCSLIVILRHYSSESGVHSVSITPNGYHRIDDGPLNESRIEISGVEDINEESLDSSGMGEVSGQSLISTNNQQNSQEESSETMHHYSPSDGEVLDWDNQPNSQEEDPSSLPAEYSYSPEQADDVSDRLTIQNALMHSSPLPPPGDLLRRRIRRWTAPAIQNISSRVEVTLARRHWRVAPFFFPFFFFKIKHAPPKGCDSMNHRIE